MAEPRFEAHAFDQGSICQAGGDQHVAGRDQHIHYEHGAVVRRRVVPGSVVDVCPYPGLAAFGPEYAQWFFGRDRLLAGLVQQLDEHARTGGLLMVVVSSGAGKSSLLRAGLLPATAAVAPENSQPWPRLLAPAATPCRGRWAAKSPEPSTGNDMKAIPSTPGWPSLRTAPSIHSRR